MLIRHAIAAVVMLSPLPALAAGVTVTSEMFVERAVKQPDGKTQVVLQKPKSVPPGAKLVFVLSYRNAAATPATNFVMTNPIPNGVAYDGGADAGATVSTDGGSTWGALAAAKGRNADGSARPARPEDVTHVRWVFGTPIPAGAQGKRSFRGFVK